jgi:predicted membrane protein
MKIKASAIVFGLLVVAAGVLLLIFNAGVLPMDYKPVVFSWQALLIAFGFTLLFTRHKSVPGIVLMLLGGFLLLPKLNIKGLAFLHGNGWAVLLIIVGIIIIVRVLFGRSQQQRIMEHRRVHFEHRAKECRDFLNANECCEEGYLERNYMFGGNKEKLDTSDFKGGDINCVFGELELDLMDAHLVEGVSTLEINTVFGGVTIYLPAHWRVEIKESQVFGHFADKRPHPNIEVCENKVLIIKASAVFGGGEIKSR